jgi:hypothetical protein
LSQVGARWGARAGIPNAVSRPMQIIVVAVVLALLIVA